MESVTTEIVPGLYRLQLPSPGRYLNSVNVYLAKGDSGHLLIDTGWDTEGSFNSLKQQLANLQVDLSEICQIVATHIHPDHYGLADRLRRLSRAEITLHSLEWEFVELRYVNLTELLLQIKQWLYINGVPTNELPEFQGASLGAANLAAPPPPEVMLHGDETISTGSFSFKAIWTPGHSPGHICLFEPSQKILISGDHILPTITPNISLNPQSSSNPLGDYLNSLNAIGQLEVKLVLPGHGNPFAGLQQRVAELFQHHERRMSEILRILKTKPKTAYQICLEMTWLLNVTVSGVRGYNLAPWDRRMAVLETLAHLEAMRADSKVDKFLKDSIIFYQCAGEAHRTD